MLVLAVSLTFVAFTVLSAVPFAFFFEKFARFQDLLRPLKFVLCFHVVLKLLVVPRPMRVRCGAY